MIVVEDPDRATGLAGALLDGDLPIAGDVADSGNVGRAGGDGRV